MLTRALTELTGKPDLVTAVQQFVHKDDIVCVKVNGIAKQNMGTNKELVLPFLEALIAAGVPPANITVLEQYGDFLAGTRINASNVPAGVKVVAAQQRQRDDGLPPHPRHRDEHEVHEVPDRGDVRDQLRAHQGSLDLRVHGCSSRT